jgi:hypothetical protein
MGSTKTRPTPPPYPRKNAEKPWAQNIVKHTPPPYEYIVFHLN